MTVLEIEATKRLGDTVIDVRFSSQAQVTALIGASGAGKTSVLNMVAGLLRPETGRIVVGDVAVFDEAGRLDLAPHRRKVGYVFQEARLFPHLNVRQNLAFGRWMNGLRRDADEEERILELLALEPLLGRRPANLSGGEKQRIAIGRALLARPRLLLLDEPLSSLDAVRKAEIMPYLERLCHEGGVPMIYVSHAADEIDRLAECVVTLAAGQVVSIENRPKAFSDTE